MLASNFLTSRELGISERSQSALISLLGMLERGEIPSDKFDMGAVGKPECGTAGCILGWTRAVDMEAFEELSGRGPRTTELTDLFVPRVPKAWSAAPDQAAVALRSYLTVGYEAWHEAMA